MYKILYTHKYKFKNAFDYTYINDEEGIGTQEETKQVWRNKL